MQTQGGWGWLWVGGGMVGGVGWGGVGWGGLGWVGLGWVGWVGGRYREIERKKGRGADTSVQR